MNSEICQPQPIAAWQNFSAYSPGKSVATQRASRLAALTSKNAAETDMSDESHLLYIT
jgi:hypothetical protein